MEKSTGCSGCDYGLPIRYRIPVMDQGQVRYLICSERTYEKLKALNPMSVIFSQRMDERAKEGESEK